jgi:hypothetical protein
VRGSAGVGVSQLAVYAFQLSCKVPQSSTFNRLVKRLVHEHPHEPTALGNGMGTSTRGCSTREQEWRGGVDAAIDAACTEIEVDRECEYSPQCGKWESGKRSAGSVGVGRPRASSHSHLSASGVARALNSVTQAQVAYGVLWSSPNFTVYSCQTNPWRVTYQLKGT